VVAQNITLVTETIGKQEATRQDFLLMRVGRKSPAIEKTGVRVASLKTGS
jgi:hypothetical protein